MSFQILHGGVLFHGGSSLGEATKRGRELATTDEPAIVYQPVRIVVVESKAVVRPYKQPSSGTDEVQS